MVVEDFFGRQILSIIEPPFSLNQDQLRGPISLEICLIAGVNHGKTFCSKWITF